MVFQTEKAMEEVGSKIDPSDKAAVEADLNALKDIIAKCGDELSDAQINDLKAGREKLMNSAQKLFEKVYQQQAGQAGQAGPQGGPGFDGGQTYGGPGAGSGMNGSNDDDVVDGDFREV
jgi:molecular chaperone DnaK